MRGPIAYKKPTRFKVKGIVCMRPGSVYSRRLHAEPLQIYRHWWDNMLGVWFCIADRPNALCIPHRYAWTPTRNGWRWVMVGRDLDLDMAIASNGLVVYDEKGPVW